LGAYQVVIEPGQHGAKSLDKEASKIPKRPSNCRLKGGIPGKKKMGRIEFTRPGYGI